ncbi:hypothetical protein ACLB9X_32300 [Streptomyces sp. 5K101]|uniref:hypothetical protein n=1 Tax=Streptomyces sp. 5K101 TaxID=3390037 RepID=UPI003977069E
MVDTDFPDDLRAAQIRLHQATAELSALCRTLPWSVEPLAGWEGTEHPHTGVVTGGRDASPGYTEGQQAAVERLRTECTDLSVTVAAHPYWDTVEREKRVGERMRLKHETLPAAAPVVDVVSAA